MTNLKINQDQQNGHQRRDEVLRDLLRNEFHRRAERNPAFSLRALSQKIEIDQSLVSKILQGKRKISVVNARKIAGFLGVYLRDVEDLKPDQTAMSSLEYELLKEDEFLVISDWHHFAILELAKTKGFKLDPCYIAARLGIHILEASRSIDRLRRLGFIHIHEEKFQLQKPNNSWLDFEKTSHGRKNLQKRLLAQSTEAIENLGLNHREHSSLIFAVDPSLLPELKKKMTEFRRSVDKFAEQKGGATEVYSLCVSLFPLSKYSENKNIKKSKKNEEK